MGSDFHERFGLTLDLTEVRRRLVNRIHNRIFETFWQAKVEDVRRPAFLRNVVSAFGEKYRPHLKTLEATAKLITEKDRDLSANRELFISRIAAGEAYKVILRQYMEYANDFRHAAKEGRPRAVPEAREVESFIYLTGLFTRLAIAE